MSNKEKELIVGESLEDLVLDATGGMEDIMDVHVLSTPEEFQELLKGLQE